MQVVLHVQPSWMVWKGELACLLGLMALLLLCIVGVTSLPSVSASLNWAEWRFVQSRLGLGALLLALGHVAAMGGPGWATAGWRVFKSITFLSSILPAATLLLRFLLAVPPLGPRLTKIRNGWERVPADSAPTSHSKSDSHDVALKSTSSTCSTSCSSKPRGILKSGCASSRLGCGSVKNGTNTFTPIYTAVRTEGEGEGREGESREGESVGVEEACVGCQESVVHASSLPSRSCQCSNV